MNPYSSINFNDGSNDSQKCSRRIYSEVLFRNFINKVDIIFISELLLCREEIASRLKMQLDAVTDPWGISVERVTMKGF